MTAFLIGMYSYLTATTLELIAKVDTGRAGRDFALRRGVERESRSGGTKQLHDERATKPQGKGTPALRVAFLEASGGVARRSQTSAGMLPSRALPGASRKCNATHGYFCNEFQRPVGIFFSFSGKFWTRKVAPFSLLLRE